MCVQPCLATLELLERDKLGLALVQHGRGVDVDQFVNGFARIPKNPVFCELWLDLKCEISHRSGQVTQFVTRQLRSSHSVCRQSVSQSKSRASMRIRIKSREIHCSLLLVFFLTLFSH
jgi:hypothetical protein